jgi:phage N-6-adenine-methyltransferase
LIRAEEIRPTPNGIAARALAAAEPGLARYDAACRALSAAKSVDEVKEIHNQSEAMRAYAKQAKNKQLEIDASEIRFRAERRIGELMAAQKETVGLSRGAAGDERPNEERGSKSDPRPTLAEAGIDKHLADRARKYAAVPEQEFEDILADRRERIETENKRVTVNLIEAGVRGTTGTGENEWYTPEDYVDAARAVLGDIDLDPASSEIANREHVHAGEFFSVEDDGLSRDWFGNVWLNPPYAQPFIAQFASKMVEEWKSGRVESAIALTHNYTDTAWFQELAGSASAICFTRGRVRFVSPSGELAAPTQGQAFFYFGHDVDAFAAAFAGIGFIAEVRK